MSAILDPVTLRDVEHLDMWCVSHDSLQCVDMLDELGRHLEAAAGRAILGASMAALVAREERRAYAEAAAAVRSCDDCGKPSCPCTDVPR